jgi:hypothetical protein
MNKYFLLILLLTLFACNTINISIDVEVVGVSNNRGGESTVLFKVIDSNDQNIIGYVIEEKFDSEKVDMYKNMVGKQFILKNYDKNKKIIEQIKY